MLRSQSVERPGGKDRRQGLEARTGGEVWRRGVEAWCGGVEDVYTDGTALRTAIP
jgi:hypothetical protein